MALCHELERRTEADLQQNVIALWHDESQLNRYAAERSDYRLLTPAYWYPEGWQMPFEQKITVRDKSRYFDSGKKQTGQAAKPAAAQVGGVLRELPALLVLPAGHPAA